MTSAAAFVVGFAAVFVALGAGVGWFGDALTSNRRVLEIVAGVFIVFAGLVFAGAQLPLTLLREKKLPLPRGKETTGSASVAPDRVQALSTSSRRRSATTAARRSFGRGALAVSGRPAAG